MRVLKSKYFKNLSASPVIWRGLSDPGLRLSSAQKEPPLYPKTLNPFREIRCHLWGNCNFVGGLKQFNKFATKHAQEPIIGLCTVHCDLGL